MDRRRFLATTAGAAAISSLPSALTAKPPLKSADSCIFIWLGGGACHVDTWDPKRKGDGRKKAGSYYDPINTSVKGVQVCQHLTGMAKLMDRCVLVRSVHHEVIDEHAAATNRLHTGRPPSGTTTYPSIGSVVAHEIGSAKSPVPGYVVMGYPSASRGPGFLGAKYNFVYLTSTKAGPATLRRAEDVSLTRQTRRERLLAQLTGRFQQRIGKDTTVRDYIETSKRALRLAGPKFMKVFDLTGESPALRQAYGGEFGQRCLLARRLVENGVRFVEVSFNLNFINGTGWDTHNDGQKNQHKLIQQLDQAMASLVSDLEKRKRLDRTLIVVATEFGRPPEFDAGGGRGHYSKAFSTVLAGGGIRSGQVVGATDELGKKILQQPVSIADFHATIHRALGIDPSKELYDGDRPVPITDHGIPIKQLF